RAFELNPNLPNSRYSVLLSQAGRAPEAVAFLKRLMRADPFYPPIYTYQLGKAHFFSGQYEQAVELIRVGAKRFPHFRPSLPLFIATAAHAGREDDARAATAELRKRQPGFTIAEFLDFMPLVRQQDRDRVVQGLHKLGLQK
ncbi:MAG TPA: hypothetical protein VMN03_09630, partial [Burkholderiales bacterium]|nr:hypothetical protein [Burkholderiales bacterium]